jgi:hypothetical protein
MIVLSVCIIRLLFYALYALSISWLHLAKNDSFMYVLDHVHAESKSKNQAEQIPVEALTNLVLDQGKLTCIPSIFLDFSFKSLSLY